MTAKPPNPFSGLDKALLRSTQSSQELSLEPSTAVEQPKKPPTSQPTRKSGQSNSTKQLASQQVSYQDSKPDSDHASLLSSNDDIIEVIRRAVKYPGKEVLFVRLTLEEKRQLADIVYTYKRQGKRTSENEINRIAVNYILEDYRANGATSILATVIDALLA